MSVGRQSGWRRAKRRSVIAPAAAPHSCFFLGYLFPLRTRVIIIIAFFLCLAGISMTTESRQCPNAMNVSLYGDISSPPSIVFPF